MTNTSARRRAAILGTAFLSASLLLSACSGGSTPASSEGAASTTRTVEADNGTIEVPGDPQRVVTIGSATTPFIDLGGEPVGATELSGFLLDKLSTEQQAAYEGATVIGTSAGEVDLEKIASLEPDLILMVLSQENYDQVGDELEAIAPTVFYSLATDGEVSSAGLAEATNNEDTYEQQKEEFNEKVASIKETYSDIIESTAFINLNRWAASETGMFAVDNTGCAEIAVSELGIELPTLTDDAPYETRSFEQLSDLSQYDVILYPVDREGEVQSDFEPVVETNTWQALPTVQSDQALGVFCASNSSYGFLAQYLDSLEVGLATLATKE